MLLVYPEVALTRAARGVLASQGPLFLRAPAVNLAVRLVQIAMERLALVFGHALAPLLLLAVLAHIARRGRSAIASRALWPPFLSLRHDKALAWAPGGRNRAGAQDETGSRGEESAFHACVGAAPKCVSKRHYSTRVRT